jgi:hypothetical protein
MLGGNNAMDKILNELNSVYTVISSIPVSGDQVDAIAYARTKLRQIHAELKKTVAERNPENE